MKGGKRRRIISLRIAIMLKNKLIKGLFILLFMLSSLMSPLFTMEAKAATVNIPVTRDKYERYRLDGTQLGTYNSNWQISHAEWTMYGGYNTYSTTYTRNYTSFTLSLPDNIRITSAYLKLYMSRDSDYDNAYNGSDYKKWVSIYNDNFYDLPISYTWYSINVLDWFGDYFGGNRSYSKFFDVRANVSSNKFTALTFGTCLYPANQYLEITYQYVPSTPQISSPVAGSNNKTNVTLTANSSVTGGGTISYRWQYSLDGATNWQDIVTTTSTSYNWNIPTSIPDNSSIYVRCMATANGVSSNWSSTIRFNKADDPAIAAKLAAENAEQKAITASEKAIEASSKATEARNLAEQAVQQTIYNGKTAAQWAAEASNQPPVVTAWWGNNKSITSSSAETLFLDIDDELSVDQLVYSVSRNSSVIISNKPVPLSQQVNISLANGLNNVKITVKDPLGKIGTAVLKIWKK
jgi:hypothetical protein